MNSKHPGKNLLENMVEGPVDNAPSRWEDPNFLTPEQRIEQLKEQGWWSPKQIHDLRFQNIFGSGTERQQWIPHVGGSEPPPPPAPKQPQLGQQIIQAFPRLFNKKQNERKRSKEENFRQLKELRPPKRLKPGDDPFDF
jgi:hypothetical protein